MTTAVSEVFGAEKDMYIVASNNGTRKAAMRPSRLLQVVEANKENAANVSSGKHRFIGREHRTTLFEAWRRRGASLMKLVRGNKGLRQLDIEAAILDELDERDRKVHALIEMLQNRSDGDTGPLPMGGAIRSSRFGGGMADAFSRRKAA
jgi:hypothetical protein